MSSGFLENVKLDLALEVEQNLEGAVKTERIFQVGHCGKGPAYN